MLTTITSRPLIGAKAPPHTAPIVVEQAGAICYRKAHDADKYDVLLISGRSSGRWGIPKGHMEAGETTHVTAAREAFEEAGVIGIATKNSVGAFTYLKDGSAFIYRVRVHLIAVLSTASDYPEKNARTVHWVPASVAACEVVQPGLRSLFTHLFG